MRKMETTQIYTQVSIRELKEIHSATHPAAQLAQAKAESEPEASAPATTHAEREELLSALAAEAAQPLAIPLRMVSR